MRWYPFSPVQTNDSGVTTVAIQSGGCGFCVGRGSEVMFLKRWNLPSKVTFSSVQSRISAWIPSSNRARLSSIETPNASNS